MVKLLLQPAHLLQQPVGVVSGHFRRDLAVGALLDPGHHLQQRGLAHPIRPRHASPRAGGAGLQMAAAGPHGLVRDLNYRVPETEVQECGGG